MEERMSKKVIASKNAPAAVGPYSQAIATKELVFTSGQIPLDPQTGEIVGETAAEQAVQVFENLRAVLAEEELTFDDVIKSTVFLTDLADFGAVNEVNAKYFEEPYPARSCFQVVALPKGAKIECEVIATRE